MIYSLTSDHSNRQIALDRYPQGNNCVLTVIIGFCAAVAFCVRMNDTSVNLKFSDWAKKLQDPHCCLKVIPVKQHLTLPPKYLGKIADGIREQLDGKLKLYSEEYVDQY